MFQKIKEGYIKNSKGKIWYQKIGTRGIPVIFVHGGPGYPSIYLKALKIFSKSFQVIFYDQLGCGKSIPKNKKDKSYWNVNYFTKELAQVVDHFNFKEFILIGHSWGAVPIVEYASNKKFKNNTKLKAVVLASPYIDSTIWKQDVIKLVQTLPGSKKNLLHKVIKNSNYNVRDFDKAIEIYSDYFMWNHYRKPKYFQQADKTFNEEMYEYMWGKSEFVVEGTLKNYSCVNRIKLIKAKSLFICGEFDEATPESTKNFSEKAKHGSYVEIKDSAHLFVTTHAKKFYKIFFDFIYSSNNG